MFLKSRKKIDFRRQSDRNLLLNCLKLRGIATLANIKEAFLETWAHEPGEKGVCACCGATNTQESLKVTWTFRQGVN